MRAWISRNLGGGFGSRTGLAVAVLLVCCGQAPARAEEPVGGRTSRLIALGRALFSDRNLSVTRTQNCVSCHSPELAFTDPRELGKVAGAVSRGADGRSLGDRNAPSLSYVGLIPSFSIHPSGEAIGGLFHDGRAATLEVQAGEPILNHIEMGMPNRASVIARVRERPELVAGFEEAYSPGVLNDAETGFEVITSALAAFERSDDFAPFDSRFDRAIKGEIALTAREREGQDIFFRKGSCSGCHAVRREEPTERETFSNYRYINLGVPRNVNVRTLNGSPPNRVDHGLGGTRMGAAAVHDGQFRVPALRNVAISGPYMHNGVFAELRIGIVFHLRGQPGRELNPETGRAWSAAEVPETVAISALSELPTLSDPEIDALVAFLKTLTDGTYENLLSE